MLISSELKKVSVALTGDGGDEVLVVTQDIYGAIKYQKYVVFSH